MKIYVLPIALIGLMVAPPVLYAQGTDCVPARSVLQQLAKEAIVSSGGDNAKAVRSIQSAVYYPLDPTSQVVYYSDAILIALSPPNWAYVDRISETLRKRDPVDAIAVPGTFGVIVSPSRINAPDIIKIVVERDGKTVEPLANELVPTPLSTAIGAQVVLHAGRVSYPCAAFLPGARVTITAIPNMGVNVVKVIGQNDLAGMSGVQPPANLPLQVSSELVGLSASDVRARLGEPVSISGTRWSFNTDSYRTLFVYIANGTVTEVRPTDVELSTVSKSPAK